MFGATACVVMPKILLKFQHVSKITCIVVQFLHLEHGYGKDENNKKHEGDNNKNHILSVNTIMCAASLTTSYKL
jgi:hypothetical protein